MKNRRQNQQELWKKINRTLRDITLKNQATIMNPLEVSTSYILSSATRQNSILN